MSSLRKKLIQIQKDTETEIINSANLSTENLQTNLLNKLESQLFSNKSFKQIEMPNFIITTSRNPSSFLITFSKHLANLFNLKFTQRGRKTLENLSEEDTILIQENKGKISSIIFALKDGPSFFFNLINLKLNRNNQRMSRINLITHKLAQYDNNENEEEISKGDKKTEAFSLFEDVLSKIFWRKEDNKRKKKFKNSKKQKARNLGFLKNENDLISFFCYEGNEFLTSFDLKMYKVMKGNLDFEGEEIFKSREFI